MTPSELAALKNWYFNNLSSFFFLQGTRLEEGVPVVLEEGVRRWQERNEAQWGHRSLVGLTVDNSRQPSVGRHATSPLAVLNHEALSIPPLDFC